MKKLTIGLGIVAAATLAAPSAAQANGPMPTPGPVWTCVVCTAVKRAVSTPSSPTYRLMYR